MLNVVFIEFITELSKSLNVRLLFLRTTLFERLELKIGMFPDKLQFSHPKALSCAKFPISAGMPPVIELLLKSAVPKLLMLPISLGMVPVNSLVFRIKSSSWVRFPISGGMEPEKLLLSNHKVFIELRLPILAGMLPLI